MSNDVIPDTNSTFEKHMYFRNVWGNFCQNYSDSRRFNYCYSFRVTHADESRRVKVYFIKGWTNSLIMSR
jgi:hypothetical protein